MALRQETERRQREREMWAAGDYGEIARRMFWEVGARIVSRVGVAPGERVLDVACGTGNAALRAAGAGARVVALDLTPELLEEGRRLATEAGVDVDWVEGDAEDLPFEDGCFDVVLSTFGCMFAPHHEVAAAELARVVAGGGRIGVCSWTPESSIADLMRTLFAYVPPEDADAPPPPLWGSEAHVRDLFAGSGLELTCARQVIEFRFESLESALRVYEETWGPFRQAREQLPRPEWSALRRDLAKVLVRHDTAAGAELVYPGEYLEVVGRRA